MVIFVYNADRNDDEIINQRINGRRVHAIARASGITVAEVNRIIDLWADQAITDKVRKHTLTLKLARLDELQQTFYARALEGDVQCGALVTKIIERRSVMLGLQTPQTAVLQIVNKAAPKETSTDKIERALDALLEDQRRKNDPTTIRSPSTDFCRDFLQPPVHGDALLWRQEVAPAGQPTPLLPELSRAGARHLGLQRTRTSTGHCGSMLLKPPPAPRPKLRIGRYWLMDWR
jgi:hypothetical protein